MPSLEPWAFILPASQSFGALSLHLPSSAWVIILRSPLMLWVIILWCLRSLVPPASGAVPRVLILPMVPRVVVLWHGPSVHWVLILPPVPRSSSSILLWCLWSLVPLSSGALGHRPPSGACGVGVVFWCLGPSFSEPRSPLAHWVLPPVPRPSSSGVL